jgi:dienelactone hydrolase
MKIRFLKMALYCVIAVVALMGVATFCMILSQHFYPFRLPIPTGPFGVGAQRDQLGDTTIFFWYPTQNKSSKATLAWAPGLALQKSDLLHKMAGFDTIFTSAQLNAPIAKSEMHYPVILYSHGHGSDPMDNTALCEDLASYGYIVISIKHSYLPAVQSEQQISYKNDRELKKQELEIWVSEAQNVLDYLQVINEQEKNMFYDKLDLNKIGMIGYSFGGATAVQVCQRDARCKASINMDGLLYGAQPPCAFKKPFMCLLSSESARFLSEKEQLKNFQTKENYEAYRQDLLPVINELCQIIGKDAYKIIINGTMHGAFSDFAIVQYRSILTRFLIEGIGALNGYRSHEIVKTYVRNFFDKYLKDVASVLLDEPKLFYPEAMIQRY